MKLRDKITAIGLLTDTVLRLLELFCNAQVPVCRELSRTAAAAKNTATSAQSTVAVRTGHAAVKGNLVYLLAEGLS